MWELYGVEDMENILLRNDGVKQHDKETKVPCGFV
jgi:hypothetical protein